ncbi:hypothetical protein PMAYCL1PPCAC_32880, partial [Pristionchus mayeri]
SQELKDLIFKVLANHNISAPNKELVRFEQIGQNRGYNSAVHKLTLEDGRTYAIKISDNNAEETRLLKLLHNRKLEFYEWLEGVRSEADGDYESLQQLEIFRRHEMRCRA